MTKYEAAGGQSSHSMTWHKANNLWQEHWHPREEAIAKRSWRGELVLTYGNAFGTGANDAADVQVREFDLHDDAVAAVAWSRCDAWCFASLSHDGRVLLNHVPSQEKYKILL